MSSESISAVSEKEKSSGYTVTLPLTNSSLASANRDSPRKCHPPILAGASWAVTSWDTLFTPSPKKRWISPWLTDDRNIEKIWLPRNHPRHTWSRLDTPKSSLPSHDVPLVLGNVSTVPKLYASWYGRNIFQTRDPRKLWDKLSMHELEKAGWFSWTEKCEV